jgi:hypothetical protein
VPSPEPHFRIEFRYTLAELAEGIAPLPEKISSFYSAPRPSPLIRGILFAAYSAIVIFLAYVAMSRQESTESWNLDVTLLAVLPPATYSFLFLVHQIWMTWRRTRPGGMQMISNPGLRPLWIRLLAAGMGICLGGFVAQALFTTTTPRHPLHIRMTPSQLVFVEYAPWFVNFILYAAWIALLNRSAPKQQWASSPSWERNKTIELDSHSFRTTDQVSKLELAWPCIQKVRETPNLFVLQAESTLRYLIPKRAFKDEQELTRLRALLQNAVVDSEFLVGPTGFAVTPKVPQPDETGS